jgi:endonuclease G, mitochondrial
LENVRRQPKFVLNAQPVIGVQRVRQKPDPIESYVNREGYRADFIGGDHVIPLPKLRADIAGDLAALLPGSTDKKDLKGGELKYTHFSMKVSKSRRLPFFSAVNINGETEAKVTRTDVWKFDPRIPLKYQILEECYGPEAAGYFSRGHMTRREDPNWGEKAVATLADADTFHAPNAAPQRQGFNGGIWNNLEDYLLKNANKDNMKVSVFSGPIFAASDPVAKGVKIPTEFWKIIVFIHDQTSELTATAYIGSQASHISQKAKPAFVFGQFNNWQAPIRRIEKLTSLNFGALKNADPLKDVAPSFLHALRAPEDVVLD